MSKEDNISLREYIDLRFCEIDKSTRLALQSLDKRLDGMNEFRNTLKDQTALFMTKDYYEARHTELAKQVEDLKLSRAELQGKANVNSLYVAYLFSVISLLLGIINITYKLFY